MGTIGEPKCDIQIRFTITRAVSGFSGLAIASANSSLPLPLREPRRLALGQHRQKPARRNLAEIVATAANPNLDVLRLRRVLNHVIEGIGFRHRFFARLQLGPQRRQMGFPCPSRNRSILASL